jgi:mRNA interferase RelE/StbE
MKRYHVLYSDEAKKALRKLDPYISKMIAAWVRKNLVGCTDPRAHGKGLSANRAGHWRYRVGDYRLIAIIHDDTVTILMLSIGHRSVVYN